MTEGIIVINKEADWTSFDVVAKLRRILGTKKIGHTGTLDPMATGVLPVAVGRATRLSDLLMEKKKTYEAVLRLGLTTDTQDITGEVLKESPVYVSVEDIKRTAESFIGDRLQIPPMYSAVKMQGRPLYQLAREGKVVERAPRPVHFYQISVLEADLPRVRLAVECSKGTYIRTLCHDMGEALGCGGCMESLVRTASGEYTLEDAHTVAEVENAVKENTLGSLFFSLEEILACYPEAKSLGEAADSLLINGNSIMPSLLEGANLKGWNRMYTSGGKFIGLYEYRESRKMYCPVKMFPE